MRFNLFANTRTQAQGLIAISGILYGTLGYFGLSLRSADFSLWNMLFWRFFSAGIFLLIFLRFQKYTWLTEIQKHWKSFLLVSVLYVVAAFCLFAASEQIGTGFAMVMFFTYPIFVTFMDWVFKDHPASLKLLICVGLVSIGTFLLGGFSPHKDLNPWGFVWGIMGAILYGVYLFSSKDQVKQINPLVVAMGMCCGSSLVALVIVLSTEKFKGLTTVSILIDVIMIGFICTALPVVLMLQGLKKVSASTAAVLSVLRPVTTVLVGAVFLKEHLSFVQILGMGIIFLGAILIQMQTQKS